MVQAVDFPAGRFTVTAAPELHAPYNARNEDGEQIVFDVWVVWATNRAGRRWQLEQAFAPKFDWVEEPYGAGWVVSGRENAEHDALTVAGHVAQRLRAGLKLDAAEWREIDPAYGSAVYQREGIEAQRAAADANE